MSPDTLGIFDSRFVLSLANNHIMDFGSAGLLDTMAALDHAGIAYAGAGPTLARACEPRLVQIAGKTIAVICAADARFSPATATSPGTCPARTDLLVEGIRAVGGSAQVIVVSLHMGLEHVSVPSVTQIRLAEACLAAGAQVVHFHHSHCSSGAATNGRGVALFGTGNYIFTKTPKVRIPAARRTAAWRVRIDKASRKVVAVGAAPAVLDNAGLPRQLDGEEARRELAQLQRCSDRMLKGFPRHWSRLRDLLSPGFLRANLYNYRFLLRSRGARYVVKSLVGGIRAQFGRPQP
jgi:poly-gamma-glutamate synthesis protein (capsule biosynthesis protein)